MEHYTENGILTLKLSGKIDSNNATDVENQINAVREAESYDAIVFDLEDLTYISSAGLRIVLRAKKNEPTLKLINANTDVYEIFDMTGFTEMLTVEKAYKKISVDGCKVIGEGANGKVYRINDDTIVKVYLNPDSLDDIRRERELAKKAFVLGIPTAISYDVARVGDSYGSVFELLNADSFAGLIRDNPSKIDEFIDLYVDLLKKIHSTPVKKGDMPDMKSVAVNWAKFDMDYLPEDLGKKLYDMVCAVPECDNMLHGDYHLKNVMMQDGEVLLIDMDTLCVGDPVFEFGSIFNAYVGFHERNHKTAEAFMGIPFETLGRIWKTTLEKYFETTDAGKLSEIERKAMVVGYMRLLRRTIRRKGTGDEEAKYFKDRLIDALSAVNDLNL